MKTLEFASRYGTGGLVAGAVKGCSATPNWRGWPTPS